MNEVEERLLHGLWHRYEVVGSELSATTREIKWLFENSIPRTRQWTSSGKLRVGGSTIDEQVELAGGVTAEVTNAFRMLESKGYVKFRTEDRYVRYAVTGLGAERARQLDTRLGRWDALYREHKDGLLNLIITIVVAAITAVFAALATLYVGTSDVAEEVGKLECTSRYDARSTACQVGDWFELSS